MAIFQRTLTATAAAATVFVALALPVGAQTPATPTPATATAPAIAATAEPTARHAHRHAHAKAHTHDHKAHGERMAQKVEKLKAQLQLTEAQQAEWTRYREALQPAPRAQRPDRESFAKLTTPERLDRMRQLRTEHSAKADQRAEATKAFYATLTPEQQKTFDAQTLRQGKHRGGHRAPHGKHHGKHHGAEKATTPNAAAPTPAGV